MERLTHKRANGIKEGYWSPNKKQELVDTLAAYENTGLTPEQIQEIDRLYAEKCQEVAKMRQRDIPERPKILGENSAAGYRIGKCTKCGNIIRSYIAFCDECGQRVDWNMYDEED